MAGLAFPAQKEVLTRRSLGGDITDSRAVCHHMSLRHSPAWCPQATGGPVGPAVSKPTAGLLADISPFYGPIVPCQAPLRVYAWKWRGPLRPPRVRAGDPRAGWSQESVLSGPDPGEPRYLQAWQAVRWRRPSLSPEFPFLSPSACRNWWAHYRSVQQIVGDGWKARGHTLPMWITSSSLR